MILHTGTNAKDCRLFVARRRLAIEAARYSLEPWRWQALSDAFKAVQALIEDRGESNE